eukprot:jgi/Botrbrau1/18976/Bobra.0100s0013.1
MKAKSPPASMPTVREMVLKFGHPALTLRDFWGRKLALLREVDQSRTGPIQLVEECRSAEPGIVFTAIFLSKAVLDTGDERVVAANFGPMLLSLLSSHPCPYGRSAAAIAAADLITADRKIVDAMLRVLGDGPQLGSPPPPVPCLVTTRMPRLKDELWNSPHAPLAEPSLVTCAALSKTISRGPAGRSPVGGNRQVCGVCPAVPGTILGRRARGARPVFGRRYDAAGQVHGRDCCSQAGRRRLHPGRRGPNQAPAADGGLHCVRSSQSGPNQAVQSKCTAGQGRWAHSHAGAVHRGQSTAPGQCLLCPGENHGSDSADYEDEADLMRAMIGQKPKVMLAQLAHVSLTAEVDTAVGASMLVQRFLQACPAGAEAAELLIAAVAGGFLKGLMRLLRKENAPARYKQLEPEVRMGLWRGVHFVAALPNELFLAQAVEEGLIPEMRSAFRSGDSELQMCAVMTATLLLPCEAAGWEMREDKVRQARLVDLASNRDPMVLPCVANLVGKTASAGHYELAEELVCAGALQRLKASRDQLPAENPPLPAPHNAL